MNDDDNISTEHQILIIMRRVLSSIVRDTTPPPGLRHPLTDSTIDDIKQCFSLITAREKELNVAQGRPEHRPRYIDEPRKSQVVKLVKSDKKDD